MSLTQSDAIPAGRSGEQALQIARRCAQEAGRIALDRFHQPHEITVKGRGDLLTETDLAVERFLHRAIAEEFPGHRMLSEETAADTATDGWVWVVDPIDGTRNFVAGIPFFCVNIALCHNGEPAVAVTYDPVHDDAFWAEREGGTWLNGRPVRASNASTVAASVLGIDLGYHDERGRAMLQLAHQLFPGVQSLRVPGSAALGLAYAACGRYDLFLHHYLYPWDIAAAILLVREAGGMITNHIGGAARVASRTVLAGAPAAHADVLQWQAENEANLSLPDEE